MIMAKNTGKKAPEAPATEEKKERTNVFLNGISEKMIQPAAKDGKTAKDGKDWQRVGVSMPGGKVGHILVLPQQIKEAKSFSKGADGQTVSNPRPGYKNILISGNVNVQTDEKDKDGNYVTKPMSAEDLKTAYEAARKEYRDAQKAAKEAGRETPDVQEPQADAQAELPEV